MVKELKVSDIVAKFIESINVDTVFGIVGGASLHLLHSIKNTKNINVVHMHHEQSCAFAADGYARVSGNIGVAVSTSGPGATNMVTGVCTSFYDSIPVLFITGQVSTFRQVGSTGCRQVGFQETPVEEIFSSITKYCVKVTDPLHILFELQKAISKMKKGRPGPVVVDIPDDIQRQYVNIAELREFKNSSRIESSENNFPYEIVTKVKEAKRPVVILGAAANKKPVRDKVKRFVERLNIPVALTWGACDILSHQHNLNIGRFGTHGNRHANFAVQNSDLIISLGSRLDTKATGTPVSSFARDACKIVVDIDKTELEKFEYFGLEIDFPVCCSISDFMEAYDNLSVDCDLSIWKAEISNWISKFNAFEDDSRVKEGSSSAYKIIENLSDIIPQNSNIICDTGCALAWMMQEFKFKENQQFFHDFNNTAMGWSVSASVGSFFADPTKYLVCVVGDGSLMMGLHDLSTLTGQGIPINIILINNSGYSMIKQTQDQWLSSEYVGSCSSNGLHFPNFRELAMSCGLEYRFFDCRSDIKNTSFNDLIITDSKSSLNELLVSNDARVLPQVKAGSPNEEMEPMLSSELFDEMMIINKLGRAQ